ncbi:hypothetical protein C8J56DRAFT_1054514 [Mycena floridula]|nr:hypothetical protein C8J56DRAFT_1054514 [Mycena floridula]
MDSLPPRTDVRNLPYGNSPGAHFLSPVRPGPAAAATGPYFFSPVPGIQTPPAPVSPSPARNADVLVSPSPAKNATALGLSATKRKKKKGPKKVVDGRITKSNGERAYVSSLHPLYGLVKDVRIGNDEACIPRPRPLRAIERDARTAGQRFRRQMNELMARAEDLSHETGCWLYIVGQHTAARRGHMSFVSDRLSREAPPQFDEGNQLISSSIYALTVAHRSTATELAIALQEKDELLKQQAAELDQLRSLRDM